MSGGAVGRPKKLITRAVRDVLTSCDDADKKIRIYPKNIMLIKHYMHVVKEIGWLRVHMHFDVDKWLMYARNQSETVHIVAVFDKESMDGYAYEEVPLSARCEIHEISEMLLIAAGDYDNVTLAIDATPNMNVKLYHSDIGQEHESIMRIEIHYDSPWTAITSKLALIATYPLRLSLPIKLLKKNLAVFGKISERIIISYTGTKLELKCVNTLSSPEHITRFTKLSNLNLGVDESVTSLSVMVESSEILAFLNGFAGSNTDMVDIYIHDTLDLIMQINVQHVAMSLTVPIIK